MNLKFLYISLLAVVAMCNDSPDLHSIEKKDIVGKWVLTKNQINYPSLVFEADATAIFRSKRDTIYYFNYVVKGDSLILRDINNKETINRIKALDSTRLVFHTLLEQNKQQIYKRQ